MRRYAGSDYALEFAGKLAGRLTAVEGGGVKADVVSLMPGPDYLRLKHIGPVGYGPVKLEFQDNLTQPFLHWIAQAIARSAGRQEVAIIAARAPGLESRAIAFEGSQISEVIFPALDAHSHDAVAFEATLQPAKVRWETRPVESTAADARNPPPFRFRLSIDGADCSRVTKIDAISVRPAEPTPKAGGQSLATSSQVVFEIPSRFAAPFEKWFSDPKAAPRNGYLSYTPRLRLDFSQLTVTRVTRDHNPTGPAAKSTIRLACARFSLRVG